MIKDLNPKILEFAKQVEKILRERKLKEVFIDEFFVEPDKIIVDEDDRMAAVKIVENLEIAGRSVNLVLRVAESSAESSVESLSELDSDWSFVDLSVIFSFEKKIEINGKIYKVEAVFRLN
jgi:hypothetical protein